MFKTSRPSRVPSLPSGYRIYAIGDVHGRDDLLEILLRKIEDELRGYEGRSVIVFLGDLIDRGPSSRQVLERLSGYQFGGGKLVFLCGNHEEAFLRVANGEADLLGDWLKFGGTSFVRSYGLDPDVLRAAKPTEAVRLLKDSVPAKHLEFLEGLHDSFTAGDYFFAHAGIRPGVPLHEQKADDLRWIRAPFLSHTEPFDAVIVHGHTISSEVDWQPSRIGVDTGAYKTHTLSAVALEGSNRWSLTATGAETSLEMAAS